jgi:hypothetical protein
VLALICLSVMAVAAIVKRRAAATSDPR